MVPHFQIVEAKPQHCGQMARRLRGDHRAAMAKLGVDTHREITDRFRSSSWRRSWLIDGALMAVGGVTGPLLASEGFIWLAFAEPAKAYRVEIVKEARRQLAALLETKHRLVTSVLRADTASCRFAFFLGFDPVEADPDTIVMELRRAA